MKLRPSSRRSLIIAAALLIGAALAPGPVADVVAADKKRDSSQSSGSSPSGNSSKSRSSSADAAASAGRSGKDSTGNKSVRTQQLAGDALAAKLGMTAGATSRPSDAPDDVRGRLSSVDASIRAEDERHEAAVAKLQRSAGTSQGKKAIEKEQASHKQRLASLNEQRQSLLVKLGDAPAAPATSESVPAAGKPSTTSRKR